MRLAAKVALISGGARGQGAAEARLFAKEGAKVVIGDILDEEGAQVAAQIAEAGGDALYVHLDATREDDWRWAIETAVSSFGNLNLLVNNAGIWANSIHPGPIDTPMGDQVWPDAESRTASIARTAISRMGTPPDIAYGALSLASDESAFVTGSELVIDGGVTAQ